MTVKITVLLLEGVNPIVKSSVIWEQGLEGMERGRSRQQEMNYWAYAEHRRSRTLQTDRHCVSWRATRIAGGRLPALSLPLDALPAWMSDPNGEQQNEWTWQQTSFPQDTPDALSRQFSSSEDGTANETILLEGFVVGAVVWGMELLVKRALTRAVVPSSPAAPCPK